MKKKHSLVWLKISMYDAIAVKIFQRQYYFSRVHSVTPFALHNNDKVQSK